MAGRLSLRQLASGAIFAGLAAVGAWVAIPLPFSPVPITLQSCVPLVAGSLLGPGLGALSMTAYLLLGLAGLPVFAGGRAGLAVLIGPTGGFLIGFILEAALAGILYQRKFERAVRFLFLTIAAATPYLVGLPWLMHAANLPLSGAIAAGLLPFLPGDFLKLVAAFVVIESLTAARIPLGHLFPSLERK
ncbi:MAG: biotin transporter BioY [Limnochordales bacterium]|nr:biotin transporter BioY [Limnochordales bacterium]